MKNIDRLARYVTKNGTDGLLIHTIAGTKNWIVAEKIELNKWVLTLLNPMGNITYNLGMVSNGEHIKLWEEITKWEIEYKTSQTQLAKDLRKKIYNFLKQYAKITNNKQLIGQAFIDILKESIKNSPQL